MGLSCDRQSAVDQDNLASSLDLFPLCVMPKAAQVGINRS
jgi:hypothetical protein